MTSPAAKTIEEIVKTRFEKEFYCHLQFVRDIALDLQTELGGDPEVIHIAAIAHDFGRQENGDNSDHAERGALEITPHLEALGIPIEKIQHIAQCIRVHENESGFTTIEEEIVHNADNLSKITYHSPFMLMNNKTDYLDRARWGLKHLRSGYKNLTLNILKERYTGLYDTLENKYLEVIANRN